MARVLSIAMTALVGALVVHSSAFAQVIPLVDEPEMTAEERLIELTLGLYAEVLAHPGACDTLWKPVRGYLDEEGPEIEEVLAELTATAPDLSPDELREMAELFRAELFENPEVDRAQTRLFDCVKSVAIQGKSRPLEKQMRRFYAFHQELFDILVGNVD